MLRLPTYLLIYDVMTFTSALLLSLMILTAIFSKHVFRGKGWFGLMSYWLVYAISYGILVGKQLGPEPTFGHCFVQTMLIYAAPPLVAVGTLCFYLDFYLGSCWDPSRRRSLRSSIAYLILAFPWLVHLAIDVEIIILVSVNSSDAVVQRNETNLYCHIDNDARPGLVNSSIVILSMVLLIPLEIWTAVQLYQSRSVRAGEDFREYLTVYLRIAACTVLAAAGFGLSAITLGDSRAYKNIRDLIFPWVSMAVSLIFASQQDLLDAWLCRPFKYFFSNQSVDFSTDNPQPERPNCFRKTGTFRSESSAYSQGTSHD